MDAVLAVGVIVLKTSRTMGEDTKNSLMRCTVANLRERCTAAGLDTSGIKADLVARLLGEAKAAPTNEATEDAAPVVAEDPVAANDADGNDHDEGNALNMASDAAPLDASSSMDVDDAFLTHVRANPSDSAALERLARLARAAPIPAARAMFDALTDACPRSSLLWQWYIDAELTRNTSGEPDDDAIRGLFGKCLIPCPSALLWRKYCAYMANTHDITSEEGVATMKSVYEYSVDIVGEDADAADVWLEYCGFLRRAPATLIVADVKPEQAESARDVVVRRCYQRAIMVPLNKLDVVYKEYEAFENEKNKALARALLQDLAPKLLLTRTALGKRKKAYEGVVVGAVCVNPAQHGADASASIVCAGFNKGACRGCPRTHECAFCGATSHGAHECSSKQYALLAKDPKACASQWAAIIDMEKSNPQKLEGANPGEPSPQLFNRVKHAYELAGLSLGETPEFWIEYAHWHDSEGRADDAAEVLQRARDALPYCALLTFAAADLEESRGNAEACKAIYESVLDDYESATAEAIERGEDVTSMPQDVVLMYCEYLRACRRVEDQTSSRKAFMRARKQPGCRWEIYATAAMLEWQYDKSDKPARNIFELGLKHFLTSPQYVERYAEFLTGINDVANARVLFERALEESPSHEVWNLFIAFERAHGTYETIVKAESRRNAAFGATDVKVNLLNALLGRHTVMDLRPATSEYCDYFASLGAVVPLRRAETAHVSYATLRSERLARAAVVAAIPPPIAPSGAPRAGKKAPPAPPSGMKKLPGALGKFFATLPGPVAFAKFPPPRVEAVLDALQATDLSEGAIEGYLAAMGYKGGEKRKAIELIDDPALAASRSAASAKPPVKDVFRARQSKMQRAQAEYQ